MDFRTEVLRAMKQQKMSAYRLAKETGLPARTVQIFVAGTQDTTTERLAKMCMVLGLELKPKSRRRAARKRGAK